MSEGHLPVGSRPTHKLSENMKIIIDIPAVLNKGSNYDWFIAKNVGNWLAENGIENFGYCGLYPFGKIVYDRYLIYNAKEGDLTAFLLHFTECKGQIVY